MNNQHRQISMTNQIILLRPQQKSYSDISNILNFETGSAETKPRSGPPKVLTKREQRHGRRFTDSVYKCSESCRQHSYYYLSKLLVLKLQEMCCTLRNYTEDLQGRSHL